MSIDNDLGTAFLARADRVGHHVDLRRHRVRTPDHHAIGAAHLARIGPAQRAGRGGEAGPGGIGADRIEEAGIALGVAQSVNRIALHPAHGAGVEIRPNRLAAVLRLGSEESLGDLVERGVPGNLLPAPLALRADASQRLHQALGMIEPLRIAGDLGADDAGRIRMVASTAHPADPAVFGQINLKCAGGRTVVRAGGVANLRLRRIGGMNRGRNVHHIRIFQAEASQKP